MKKFKFECELWLPRKRDEIFAFFSNAQNLGVITPAWLQFQILTPVPIDMRPGARIDYRLHVHGIPIRWQTEIAGWNPPADFVDVQARGPYKLWEHTHLFEEVNGGTLCRDRVVYCPLGGAIVNWLFVRRDVERIFAFRQERLKQLFRADQAARDGLHAGVQSG